MSNPPKPILRFPGFTSKWVEAKFGDLYTFKIANSLSRADLNEKEGKIKNIHYGDIHKKFASNFRTENEEVPFINIDVDVSKIKEENYVIEGDLVIADASEDYADIGKAIEIISLDDFKTVAGLHTLLARRNSTKIANGFFSQLLKTNRVRKQVMRIAQGTKVLSISSGRYLQLNIALPDKEEQQKIATFLSLVDGKLSALRHKHELFQHYKRGCMQKIFSQETRFKRDDGTYFPDWGEKKLGDVFHRVANKNKLNCLNVLTISAQQGLINQKEYFKKSVSAKDVTGYYYLKKGDFAYNKSYSKGYPMGAIKRLNRYEEGVVSTLYICFSTEAEVTSQFFEQYFDAGNLNRELHKIAQEGARNHGLLNLSVIEFFRDISIPFPSLKEQQVIASFLSGIDIKIDVLANQIKQTEAFQKALLQKMFI